MLQKNKWLRHTALAGMLLMVAPVNSAFAAVITSIRPLGFIASSIADGVVPTEVLLPDGASPHDYSLRPSDVQRLRSADLVIWVGSDLENFLSKLLVQVDSNKQIALSKLPTVSGLLMKGGDDHEHEDEHEHEVDNHSVSANADTHKDQYHHSEYDMHIWLSPEISKQAAIAIHAKLLELKPQSKQKLDANLRQFEEQLALTEKNIINMLQSVKNKGYFVFHDAYGYFEKHFGLASRGYFTVNPEIQPSALRLYQIQTALAKQEAVCVFAEPQFRPAVINAVVKGTDVRVGILDPLGSAIKLGKDSYVNFLSQLSNQYMSCLK